mmetsp:Transcript_22933/g.54239  ORF Transcript_22933/g.54239 Transcript_22933/m.54239 type:complete len:346 (-) Transcript_22933:2394-3431(-)
MGPDLLSRRRKAHLSRQHRTDFKKIPLKTPASIVASDPRFPMRSTRSASSLMRTPRPGFPVALRLVSRRPLLFPGEPASRVVVISQAERHARAVRLRSVVASPKVVVAKAAAAAGRSLARARVASHGSRKDEGVVPGRRVPGNIVGGEDLQRPLDGRLKRGRDRSAVGRHRHRHRGGGWCRDLGAHIVIEGRDGRRGAGLDGSGNRVRRYGSNRRRRHHSVRLRLPFFLARGSLPVERFRSLPSRRHAGDERFARRRLLSGLFFRIASRAGGWIDGKPHSLPAIGRQRNRGPCALRFLRLLLSGRRFPFHGRRRLPFRPGPLPRVAADAAAAESGSLGRVRCGWR